MEADFETSKGIEEEPVKEPSASGDRKAVARGGASRIPSGTLAFLEVLEAVDDVEIYPVEASVEDSLQVR